jgi:hypothetical protein
MRLHPAFSRRLRLAVIVCSAAMAACQMMPGGTQSTSAVPADPDSQNELPFGFVDAPAEGAGVGRQIQMYGWALDDRGVKDVRIFVDGKYVTKTGVTVARPDVMNAHPAYSHGTPNHGWAVTVTLADAFQPGPHTIIAQAVDTQGATRDIGVVTVSLAP